MGIKGSIIGVAALAIVGYVLARVFMGEGQQLGASTAGLGIGIGQASAGFATAVSNIIAAPVAGLQAWKSLFGLGGSVTPGTTGGSSGTTGGVGGTTTQSTWSMQGIDPITQAKATALGYDPSKALTTSQIILMGGL